MSANGFLSYSELAPIDNDQWLWPRAAAWYNVMRAFAASQGVRLVTTEGYRDYATQVYLWNLYLSGQGNPASPPGSSPHGLGYAWDGNTGGWNTAVYNWLAANAGGYGWNNRVGIAIGEHWHWVFEMGGDTWPPGYDTAGGSTSPFPIAAPYRRLKMIQAYLNQANTHVAFGVPDPFDEVQSRLWVEYPLTDFNELDLFAPIRISNAAWNNRSNAARRIGKENNWGLALAAMNSELTKLGRELYYPAAPTGGAGVGGNPSEAWTQLLVQRIDDAISDEAIDKNVSTIAAAIGALDTQSDTYQSDLKAILSKGLTISITGTGAATPKP